VRERYRYYKNIIPWQSPKVPESNVLTVENSPLHVGHISPLYRQQILFFFQRKGFRRFPVFAHPVHVGAAVVRYNDDHDTAFTISILQTTAVSRASKKLGHVRRSRKSRGLRRVRSPQPRRLTRVFDNRTGKTITDSAKCRRREIATTELFKHSLRTDVRGRHFTLSSTIR